MIGFNAHINKVNEFKKLVTLLTEKNGPEINAHWLGIPYPFHIPYLDFEKDPDTGAQRHILKVTALNMFLIPTIEDVNKEQALTPPPFLFLGNEQSEGFLVSMPISHTLKLARTALYNRDGMIVTRQYEDLMQIHNNGNVEDLFSCYFSMQQLNGLKIGTLKKISPR